MEEIIDKFFLSSLSGNEHLANMKIFADLLPSNVTIEIQCKNVFVAGAIIV